LLPFRFTSPPHTFARSTPIAAALDDRYVIEREVALKVLRPELGPLLEMAVIK